MLFRSIVMFAAITFDAIWSALDRRRGIISADDQGEERDIVSRVDAIPDLATGALDEVHE